MALEGSVVLRTEGPQDVAPAQGVPPHSTIDPDLLLLLRFLVGVVALGSRGLAQQLRRIDASAGQGGTTSAGDQPVLTDAERRFVYSLIGLSVRSQIWGWRRLRHGTDATWTLLSWLARSADRMTAHPLLFLVRRPLDTAVRQVSREIELAISLGQEIEAGSQQLAHDTVASLTDQVIAYIALSPELAALVRSQVQEQSSGFVETVVDSSRNRAMEADNRLESLVRRFLRRGEAPPHSSEAVGRAVYNPAAAVDGASGGT